MVAAADFNDVFDEVVARSLLAMGAWQRGRRLFYTDDSVVVAILRVEHRWIPPAELQMAVRYRGMRAMDDAVPSQPPTNPLEYPIRIRPSQADTLLSPRWTYTPETGRRGPTDSIAYPVMTVDECRSVLTPIGTKLTEVLPQLSRNLTVARVLHSMRDHASDTWIEQRWIADLIAVSSDDS